MIGRICLLLEALSIVICLHHLYGKKFKLDIATLSLLAIDMIMMTTIDYFGWPSTLSIIIYPIIAVYCGIEFGFEWKKIIVSIVASVAIIGILQVIITLGLYYLFGVQYIDNFTLLFANGVILLISIFGVKRYNIKKWFKFINNREVLITVSLICCSLVVVFCIVNFKVMDKFDLKQYLFLFIVIILITFLSIKLGKYKIRAKEIETELRMHELYAESFKSLIENVRMRQHEFDNHLNTIYSMHLLCNSFDELVEKQQSQCKELEKDNRYNKLLKNDNQIIRGFLYTNFLKAEKLEIEVSYEIMLNNLDIEMPIYRLVEILGDLINNAVEAMLESKMKKRLHVSMIEVENCIEIEVRNTSEFVPRSEIAKFFEKGYSKKGDNRGLGLYNVKKICDDYGFKISFDNKMLNDESYLSFLISNKR